MPDSSPDCLTTDRVAMDFADGLPLGNGRIGLMCHGGPGRLVFTVNHYDLWYRPTVKTRRLDGVWDEIRRLAAAGDWVACERLRTGIFRSFPSAGNGSFQPAATIEIIPVLPDGAMTFTRRLDFATGVATAIWESAGEQYTVSAWTDASAPAATVELRTTARSGWRAVVQLYRAADDSAKVTTRGDGDGLGLAGRLRDGTGFDVAMSSAGAIAASTVDLTDARPPGTPELYAGRQSQLWPELFAHPRVRAALVPGRRRWRFRIGVDAGRGRRHARTVAPARARAATLPGAAARPLARAQLELPGSPVDLDAPRHYQHLWATGRYLFTASCFPDGLPPNLQGIWNNRVMPVCFSDYHMDLNLQMNMWHVPTGNLLSYNEALFRLVEGMVPGARRNARHAFNMRGISFPGCTWGQGEGRKHADTYPGIGGWLMEHYWQHWRYTCDAKFLRQRCYPLLREVCRFYLDYLQVDGARLVISPSVSPENRIPERSNGQSGLNSTFDLSVFRGVFEHTLAAAHQLGAPQDALLQETRAALPILAAYPISPGGALMELEDYEWQKGHRHLSHLHVVFPGDQATPEKPQLFAAARRALARFCSFPPTGTEAWIGQAGYDTWAGWTYILLALTWARFGEGDQALGCLRRFSRAFRTDGGLGLCFANDDLGFGLLYSPFHAKWIQIDAALGATAAVQEMLLQSHGGIIRLLPALPGSWPDGQFRGFRAEGAFELDLSWRGGRLREARLRSLRGSVCCLKEIAGSQYRVQDAVSGAAIEPSRDRDQQTIRFPTRRGQVFLLRRR